VATPGRRTDRCLEYDPVRTALFERGYEFEFFQAMRLLLRLYPERKQVGGVAKAAQEVARFRGPVSLAFPPSAIDHVAPPEDESSRAEVAVAFMGLTGVMGVLPLHYSERIIARRAARDTTFAAFLDIFNHRFISLFYRAWEKHRPAALIEAAGLGGREVDVFTQYLFDLIGMGTEGLRGRMRVFDNTLLWYAGLIAQKPHSASALRGILRDYLALPVEISQFRGGWYSLAESDRSYMSFDSERNQLGVGAFIGSKVWDQQARFRIRLGPVDLPRFREFLPGGIALGRVMEFTRFLVGQAVAFDVQVVLSAPEIPHLKLTSAGPDAPQLGWLGWLKTRESTADAEDSVFRSDAVWAASAA
jgi:type VI secretion system protein ImpH